LFRQHYHYYQREYDDDEEEVPLDDENQVVE
jgi:hypothetical protein